VRRVAELCDAWHPLGLTLDDLEKGFDTIRELAAKAGRSDVVGCAPRNLLNLTANRAGTGRAAFAGTADEIAADIQRVQAMGCDYMTFDLPSVDVPGMVQAMERFMAEVKPAVG
jgi:alkanesulfonate monooxygenase SsuD/methylene tetrahydromethanopterin reductase-like flavin-dependent oxidoreductase (luciferase family)